MGSQVPRMRRALTIERRRKRQPRMATCHKTGRQVRVLKSHRRGERQVGTGKACSVLTQQG